jgi:outer membrane receptor protein involved in Fe transport
MTRLLATLLAVVAFSFTAAVPCAAQDAATATGTIEGRVTDTEGTPVAGASLVADGPARATATTDSKGGFVLSVPPGLYQITASKSGFSPATEADFTVLGGTRRSLTVKLAAATLTSLREIGRVSVSSRNSGFNASPASVQTISSQVFQDQGVFQVQRVLDQTPGIVIDHPGTNATNAALGAITFPSIRGGLGFETASLIDGHPLAVQTFGDYVTTFLVADVLQDVELIKGPGAAAPEVNYAIGGTVNFRTVDPTKDLQGYLRQGYDSYGGLNSAIRVTDSFLGGKLGFAGVYVAYGSPGALQNAPNYVTLPSTYQLNGSNVVSSTTSPVSNSKTNGIQNNPNYANSTLLACCLDVNQNYTNHTELAKLRYDFSGSTSATVSYLGSQTYTDQNGNHLYNYVTNFAPSVASGYSGALAPGAVSTWQSVSFPNNYYEMNNEPIFQAEARTTFRGDAITGRYYTASISRLQYQGGTDFTQPYNYQLTLFGSATICPPGLIYNSTAKACGPTGGPYKTPAINQAYDGPVTITESANAGWYRATEHDLLHGGSAEYDHFFGASGNVLSLSFNQVSMTTDSFSQNGALPGTDVPVTTYSVIAGSREVFTTELLRYIGNLTPQLNLTFSNYFNQYQYRTTENFENQFTVTNQGRYDGRLGLAYRYTPDVSLRASAGSAIAPPYLALLEINPTSTVPSLSSDATYATNSIGNPNIKPETSFGYDIGADARLSQSGDLFSTDLYYTNLWGQFIQPTIPNGNVTLCATGGSPPCPPGVGTVTVPLYSKQYQNLGLSRYEGFEFAFTRDPNVGWGYKLQGDLMRAFPVSVGPCTYASTITNGVLNCSVPTTNLGIIPGSNYYDAGTSGSPGSFNAVNNHAIPYSQGYGELHYRTERGGYLAFGIQYYGNNNSLNVPAFFSTNGSIRFVFPKQIFLQASVQNLNNAYRAAWTSAYGGAGVPLANGKIGLTNANTLGPAYWNFSLEKKL